MYPILNTLENDGYVVVKWEYINKKSIKRYRITDEGLVKLRTLNLEYFRLNKNGKSLEQKKIINYDIVITNNLKLTKNRRNN